jgi:hypothetical protein
MPTKGRNFLGIRLKQGYNSKLPTYFNKEIPASESLAFL